LENMASISVPENRAAQFCCAVAYVARPHDPSPLTCIASWRGQILSHPVGHGGFGYDPLFFIPELGRSAAELSPDEKSRYSHRAQAMALLLRALQQRYG